MVFKYPINVTIDTNVFDSNNYDFGERSTFQVLANHVDSNKVKVILSNIVIKETEKHIAKRGMDAANAARKIKKDMLKLASEHQIRNLGLDILFEIPDNREQAEDRSIEILHTFLESLRPEILDTSKINIDNIIDDYFNIRPPFEERSEKRKEFPDAFIANQIRERFGNDEIVAIISADEGFKKACGLTANHLFFDSLGSFYAELNKQDERYECAVNKINYLTPLIAQNIRNNITDDNVEVNGLTYDKDRIIEGYDYTDISINKVGPVHSMVHYIEDIDDTKILLTMKCSSFIDVDCYYEDYDNAFWDSENQQFLYTDTVGMFEKHHARFACQIEINVKDNTFTISPFKILLGNSSLKERISHHEIYDAVDEYDDYVEIENIDRESAGLMPLDSYTSYMEDDLAESEFAKRVTDIFDELNGVYGTYEDIASRYEDLLDSIKTSKEQDKIESKIRETVPLDECEDIIAWLKSKIKAMNYVYEGSYLPDEVCFGDTIRIKGIYCDEMILSIDSIAMNPSAGDTEQVDLALYKLNGGKINGYIQLTVGCVEVNEDGCVSAEIQDDIDYYCDEIISNLELFALNQTTELKNDEELIDRLEETISSL